MQLIFQIFYALDFYILAKGEMFNCLYSSSTFFNASLTLLMKLEIACYQKVLVYIGLRVFFSKNYLCQNNLDIPQIAAKAREVIDKEQGQQYHYWQYEQKTLETSQG